jgi:hypothetical protein
MNAITVTIQIGNSDNKLAQSRWAEFIQQMEYEIAVRGSIQFCGGSHAAAPWQNFCWVVNCPNVNFEGLKAAVKAVREKYNQDSAAFTPGDTSFV